MQVVGVLPLVPADGDAVVAGDHVVRHRQDGRVLVVDPRHLQEEGGEEWQEGTKEEGEEKK